MMGQKIDRVLKQVKFDIQAGKKLDFIVIK